LKTSTQTRIGTAHTDGAAASRTSGHWALRTVGVVGFALLTIFSLFGCAATVDSTDETSVANLEPTLENVQKHVFDQACATSGCHTAETAAGGLDLSTADASYAALVGQPATNGLAAENHWTLVAPEDPDLSFLCRKLEQPGMGEGAPMPPGEYMVAPEYIELVEDWIAEGAQR